MKTNLNFNSAICTSREQSERLLALGLKAETADCAHCYTTEEHGEYKFWDIVISDWEPYWDVDDENIPAWSLDRLIDMLNNSDTYEDYKVDFHVGLNRYDEIIALIQSLIHIDGFNKKYLSELHPL